MKKQRVRIPGLVLTGLMVVLAAMAEEQEQDAGASNDRPMVRTGMEAEAIARVWPDAAVWLTSQDGGRKLALFQPESETPAKGAILLLTDEGQTAAAELSNALRESLSRDGWAVMSIGLEPPAFEIQQLIRQQDRAFAEQHATPDSVDEQTSGDAGQQAGDSVMIDVLADEKPVQGLEGYRDRVVSNLTRAVDALEEREYRRIVLAGIGWAAGHVTRQARQDGRASDLVWIAPRFHADESQSLTELLATAASPSVLELHSTFPGDRTADRSASQRAAALARAGIEGYQRQPVAMARRPMAREAGTIANRVSAWLMADKRQPQ